MKSTSSKTTENSQSASIKNVVGKNQISLTQVKVEKIVIGQDNAEALNEIKEGIADLLNRSNFAISSADNAGKRDFDEEIKETAGLLNSGDFEKARPLLFKLLGKVEEDKEKYKTENTRILNNLGVSYINDLSDENNTNSAIEYFDEALSIDPNFNKAKVNKASALLRSKNKKDYAVAREILEPIWKSKQNEPDSSLTLQLLIRSIYLSKSLKSARNFISKKEINDLIIADETLAYTAVGVYVESKEMDKANELLVNAIHNFPNSALLLSLQAKILMLESQRDYSVRSYFDVIPAFTNLTKIEKAVAILENASKQAVKDKNHYLENQIKYDIVICSMWLGKSDSKKYKDVKNSLIIDDLDEQQLIQLEIHNFGTELNNRNFEIAYELLKDSKIWELTPYDEKKRVARLFLYAGAPEQAIKVYSSIEKDAESKKDAEYYMDTSMAHALLENKKSAIADAEKAYNLGKKTDLEEKAFKHSNAINQRFSETDRLMRDMLEYDSKHPDAKVVWKMQAFDEKGQLTEEARKMFTDQKNWFDGIREKFTSLPLPIYFLEKTFGRPFVSVISEGLNNGDLNFTSRYNEMSLLEENKSNFQKAGSVVFDYSSLLNISKMDLLSHLDKLNKKMFISESLFVKIQEELLTVANLDLRKLWDFLRKTKDIKIIKVLNSDQKMKDVFDPWLLDTIELADRKKAVFFTDDFTLQSLMKGEKKLSVANSLVYLTVCLEKGWIDKKMYSEALGDLAERLYIFLPFNFEDLFHIVMEDQSKITMRSTHLINGINLPGSDPLTFTAVYVGFIDKLWQTGSLAVDKIKWLELLSSTNLSFIEKHLKDQPIESLRNILIHTIRMCRIAISKGSKDELILLKESIPKIFEKNNFELIKNQLLEEIEDKLKTL